jgi:AcrR family transcriptional regulator
MAEIADEARVSRATAYRYFPSIDALLYEAPVDLVTPDPHGLFADSDLADPVQRVDAAEAALHEMVFANETQLRAVLCHSLKSALGGEVDAEIPRRQNRRIPLIEAALSDAKCEIAPEVYQKLTMSLAFLFGPEGMLVCRDVLGIDAETARSVKSWAIQALVRSALEQSSS